MLSSLAATAPALSGWANFCRASGAPLEKLLFQDLFGQYVMGIKCRPTAFPFFFYFRGKVPNRSCVSVVRPFQSELDALKFMKTMIIRGGITFREKHFRNSNLIGNKQSVCQEGALESLRDQMNRYSIGISEDKLWRVSGAWGGLQMREKALGLAGRGVLGDAIGIIARVGCSDGKLWLAWYPGVLRPGLSYWAPHRALRHD